MTRYRLFAIVPAVVGLIVLANIDVNARQGRSTAPAASSAAKTTLPAAVSAAFKKAYPNATIKNVSKEKEGGVEEYEVESVDNGTNRDLVYKPDGTLVLYEEQIRESDLPAVVASAIKTRYPQATFTRCEKLFQNGTMNYEVALKGAKASEVTLTPEGKWVSPK